MILSQHIISTLFQYKSYMESNAKIFSGTGHSIWQKKLQKNLENL